VLKQCAKKCDAALAARSQASFSPDDPPHLASSAHLLPPLLPFHPPFSPSAVAFAGLTRKIVQTAHKISANAFLPLQHGNVV
jgi:hypothetical protein